MAEPHTKRELLASIGAVEMTPMDHVRRFFTGPNGMRNCAGVVAAALLLLLVTHSGGKRKAPPRTGFVDNSFHAHRSFSTVHWALPLDTFQGIKVVGTGGAGQCDEACAGSSCILAAVEKLHGPCGQPAAGESTPSAAGAAPTHVLALFFRRGTRQEIRLAQVMKCLQAKKVAFVAYVPPEKSGPPQTGRAKGEAGAPLTADSDVMAAKAHKHDDSPLPSDEVDGFGGSWMVSAGGAGAVPADRIVITRAGATSSTLELLLLPPVDHAVATHHALAWAKAQRAESDDAAGDAATILFQRQTLLPRRVPKGAAHVTQPPKALAHDGFAKSTTIVVDDRVGDDQCGWVEVYHGVTKVSAVEKLPAVVNFGGDVNLKPTVKAA
jgi:hypothetical protein